VLIRRRLVPCLLIAAALLTQAPKAQAAAEFHKLNLMFSANPSSFKAEDYKSFIDEYNQRVLIPRDLKEMDKISWGWRFEAEIRYFATNNVAISAGVGQLRTEVRQEYLPRLSQRIEVRTNIVSAPVHVGGSYYFSPYNQGDFRARAYIGGGIMAHTNSKVFFEQLEFNTDTTTTLGGSARLKGRGESPGYYAEFGAHLWFATRLSVMLGMTYRSADMEVLRYDTVAITPGGVEVPYTPPIKPETLDLSGISARFAILIGL
jgi:hypothetical protein